MGFIEGLMSEYDLTDAEREEMDAAKHKDGEPNESDLLIMQYHVATTDYAEDDVRLQQLHSITKAYFYSRFPATIQTAGRIGERRYGPLQAPASGASH